MCASFTRCKDVKVKLWIHWSDGTAAWQLNISKVASTLIFSCFLLYFKIIVNMLGMFSFEAEV